MSAARRPGRPRQCPDHVLEQILAWLEEGCTFQQICDALNGSAIKTPGGSSRWYRSHVSRLLRTRSAQEFAHLRMQGARNPEFSVNALKKRTVDTARKAPRALQPHRLTSCRHHTESITRYVQSPRDCLIRPEIVAAGSQLRVDRTHPSGWVATPSSPCPSLVPRCAELLREEVRLRRCCAATTPLPEPPGRQAPILARSVTMIAAWTVQRGIREG
ncbi:recombinase family protein [Prescottella equi]|uniref:recombinase family protein n=1 Tax=Rhodococcus hoagii TaxID=43767 RepID=UPI0009C052F4